MKPLTNLLVEQWRPDFTALTAQYFLSLDDTFTGNTPTSRTQVTSKSMNDIYMGVDVWGRGSHGGGGFGCYKAISHISPETLGLSVALFGHAWTWESEQDKPGWTWEKWWAYESKLWVGISGSVEVPDEPQNGPVCPHGPFLSIASFFPRQPPPEPSQLSFYTNFCPGSGTAWFVEGVKVFQNDSGWTDVEKQTSVGDMLWPFPTLFWDDDREDEIPKALSCFYMDDAWNGGNSIRISISCPSSKEATAAYRSLWLPIQSLHLMPQRSYEAHAIYKLEHNHIQDLETECAISFKSLPGSQDVDLVLNIVSTSTIELTGGWTKLTIQFNLSGNELQLTAVAIGLVIAIVSENPTEPLQLPFLLGQLNVSSQVPLTFTEEDPLVLWADFTPTPASNKRPTASPLSGTLSWEVAASFPIVTQTVIKSPEDPLPAWNLQPTIDWFPSFLYFNIYAQPFADKWNVGTVDDAVWIGTSGSDGQRNGFDILPENLPFAVNNPATTKIRFYIQGVKDCGEVLKWQKCAYVDVSSS